ncbi:MAG: DMT family transporter [Pseudomonadota bacterium]
MSAPSPIVIAAFGVFCGCAIDVFVKALSASIPVLELTVWRFVFGGLIALGIFIAWRRSWPTWEAWRFHTMRGVVHLGAALLFFYSLTQLGLAEATVIGFTAALMIAPIARVLLGERFGTLTIVATVIGCLGALLTASGPTPGGPPDGERVLGTAAVLGSALCYATSVVLLRMRAQKEDALTIVMLANVLPGLIGLPLLLMADPTLDPDVVPSLIMLGFFGLGIWWLFTLAYARAPAQKLAPVEYTAVIWSALFGALIFGEVPGWTLYAGASIIVAACLLAGFEDSLLHAIRRRQSQTPRQH